MKAHITNLGLENFRVFKNKTHFEFAPITILTGTNSSGKSSLINAMELLQGFEITRQLNESNGLSEYEFPTILNDISSLQLSKYAQTKGDFSNLRTKGSKADELSFTFRGEIQGINFPCKLVLTYSGKSNKIGYQNGELSELRIEAIEEKNAEYAFIQVFRMDFSPESIETNINWKYFYEHYKLNAEKVINRQRSKPNKISGEGKDLAELFEAAKYTALLNKALIYDKESNSIIMFEPQKQFLTIPIPSRNNSKIKWFDNLNAFNEKHNSILTSKLDDNVNESMFLEQVNSILIPLLQQAFIDQEYFSSIVQKIEPWGYSNIEKVLKEIEFGGNSKKEITNTQNLFESFTLEFDLHLVFSNDPNGKAAKLFFESFILKGVQGLLASTLPQFQGINFLKTNRTLLKRRIDILELKQLPNQTEYFVNLLVQSNEKVQEVVMATLNRYFSREYLNISEEVVINAKDSSKDSAVIMLRKGEYWFNLADEGFGINTLFSVILLAVMSNDKLGININRNIEPSEPDSDRGWQELGWPTVLVIEEPESNLHPALQSKLADVFVDVAKRFNTQFIIETHSEYLIRKLQYLTAKGEIKQEDTAIYYFYPPDDVPPGEDQVKRIDIQEDGSLTDDFGRGFFDEADKIAMSIWNMNKSQKN